MKYSLYNSKKSTSCHQVSVAELLERIGTKELKEKCAKIAAHILAGEEKEANQLKSELPCIVVAELYKEGAPRKAGSGEPTGLFMMDWDDCKSMEELTELQNKIKTLAVSHPVLKDLIVAAHTSPRLHGVHVFSRWIEGCYSIEECQAKFAEMADLPNYDKGCKDPSRCSYLVHKDMFFVQNWGAMERNEEYAKLQKTLCVSPTSRSRRSLSAKATIPSEQLRPTASELTHSSIPSAASYATRHSSNEFDSALAAPSVLNPEEEPASPALLMAFDLCAKQAGLNPDRMDVWGERNWHTNLMAMLSLGIGKLMKREQLRAVVAVKMPNYSKTEDCQKLINYFYDKYGANEGFMNAGLREINAKTQDGVTDGELGVLNDNDNANSREELDLEDDSASNLKPQISNLRMPQGVKDSIDAVGSHLAMPVVTAICPCIGALATGVVLDVHGRKKGLNLIAYIAGDFASGKGDIDPVVDAWMSEVQALDKMYQMQEDEWRAKKRAAKNKKEQPEEPKLPVRCLTLNNTVANLAERLSNTEGKHAFSFTPEADTVAQKWKSTLSDFSVMLRQSYDGSRYEREARSAEAVNVHIEHLLWNVTMCGTPDALYRVVSNYTDGFQSRIAVARTPDNTFAPLEEKPYVLTSRQAERIQQVAHLLPLMQGEVVLPKLEAKGR